jgi:hypothetical protein
LKKKSIREERKAALNILVHALIVRDSFYILGAGVSAGLAPLTKDLRPLILKECLKLGSYPIFTPEQDTFSKRIIDDISAYVEDEFDLFKLTHTHKETVRAITMKLLTPNLELIKRVPCQYEYFRLSQKATIFSMNNDGLANRYCPNHRVLEPHGKLPSHIVNSPLWKEVIENSQEMEIEPPFLNDIW